MPDIQPDFESMYFQLFRKMADAIQLLQRAQQEAEEAYIQGGLPETEACRIADAPPEPEECVAATPAETP